MTPEKADRSDLKKLLGRLYIQGALLPAVPAAAGNLICLAIAAGFAPSQNNGDIIWTILLLFFAWFLNSLIFLLLSSLLFLNLYPAIRRSTAASGTAWMLLPTIWIALVFAKCLASLTEDQEHRWLGFLFLFSNTLPYLAGLVVTFIRFRKEAGKEGRESRM